MHSSDTFLESDWAASGSHRQSDGGGLVQDLVGGGVSKQT